MSQRSNDGRKRKFTNKYHMKIFKKGVNEKTRKFLLVESLMRFSTFNIEFEYET